MEISLEPKRTAFDLQWRMFTVPIRVHPWFWLTALILSYQREIPFSWVLVSMGCVFVSVLVHEFGHIIAQRHYGDRDNRIVLWFLGGLAIGSRDGGGHKARIHISLAGPMAGLALGGIAFGIGAALWGPGFVIGRPRGLSPGAQYGYVALWVTFWISAVWGLVNLLPIFPLDGGQIAREWIRWKTSRGEEFAFKVSFITALVVAGLGIAKAFSPWSDSNDLFLIVMFIVFAVQNYILWRQIRAFGGMGSYDEGPRQSWEQDADWWKRNK